MTLVAPAEATVVAIDAPVGTAVAAGQVDRAPGGVADDARRSRQGGERRAGGERGARARAAAARRRAGEQRRRRNRARRGHRRPTRCAPAWRNAPAALTLRAPAAGIVDARHASGRRSACRRAPRSRRSRAPGDAARALRRRSRHRALDASRHGACASAATPRARRCRCAVVSVSPVVDPQTRLASILRARARRQRHFPGQHADRDDRPWATARAR